MSQGTRGAQTAARMADTLLRSLGGSAVMLRIPGDALAAQDAEQLGLGEPRMEEIAIGPAVFRRVMSSTSNGTELLVSATTIERVMGMLGFDAASELFAQATGVVVHDRLMPIVSVSASEMFGRPYLYRLQLRGALNVAG